MPVTIKNRWTDKPIATVEDTDDLREAVIRLVRQGVSLRAANLSDADLSDADLRDADLRDADLRDADLRDADLRAANLRDADLSPIRDDFYAVLSFAPAEVPALIAALDEGRVNGSCYSDGACGCLIGTLAIASGIDPQDEESCAVVHGLEGNSSRPAEVFFLAIRKGHTPENSQHAKLARDWAVEWLGRMQTAFGAQSAHQLAEAGSGTN